MICDICKYNNKCKIIKSIPAISCDKFSIMQNYYEKILNSIKSNIKTAFIINTEKNKTLNIHVGTITSISNIYIRAIVKDDIYNFHIFPMPFCQYKTMFFFDKDDLDKSIAQDWIGYNVKYHEPQKNENGELETNKHLDTIYRNITSYLHNEPNLSPIVPEIYRNSISTTTNYRTVPNFSDCCVDYHAPDSELDRRPPLFF